MKFNNEINAIFNEKDLELAIISKADKYKEIYKISLRNGYACLCIGHKHVYLHRLLAEYYFGKDEYKLSVHHKNKNKLDNSIDNLKVVSSSEHAKLHKSELKHKTRTGIIKSQMCATKSITRYDVTQEKVLELRDKGMTYPQIAEFFKCGYNTVWRRINGNPKILDWSVEE